MVQKKTKAKRSNSKKTQKNQAPQSAWFPKTLTGRKEPLISSLTRKRALKVLLAVLVVGGGIAAWFGFVGGGLVALTCKYTTYIEGSRGDCVELAVQMLESYTGVIPESDGTVTANVASAIRSFQKAYNLPVTGKLDQPTWEMACRLGTNMSKDSEAYKAAVKAGCLKNEPVVGTPSNPTPTTPTNPTQPGDGSSGGNNGGATETPPPTTTPTPTPNPNPPAGNSGKPTDASTGPRVATTTTRAGGTISGTFNRVQFNGSVEIPAGSGPTTLTDCVINGQLSIRSTELVIIDHCDINGWFGHRTNNKDKSKQLLIIRNSKLTGPTNNDAVRFANTVGWGDNSTYQNTLVEDTIIHSPFVRTQGAHFDAIQFGGGNNHIFNRVLISYTPGPMISGAVAYVNNDTQNGNVVFNDLWIEGGGVSYVLRGGMTINNCTIATSAKGYGYVGGSGAKLNNCFDSDGKAIR